MLYRLKLEHPIALSISVDTISSVDALWTGGFLSSL